MSSPQPAGDGTEGLGKLIALFVMAVFVIATTADLSLQYAASHPTEGAKHAIDLLDFIAKTSLGTILGLIAGDRSQTP